MNIKKLIIGILASLCIFIAMVCILVLYDMYLHEKFLDRGGLNYQGYRGEIVGKKESDEIRIGIFGGSVAMGYGVHYSKSMAGILQKLINNKKFKKKYTVINLAATGEAPYTYLKSTYTVFSYLDIDVLVFYFCSERFENKLVQGGYSERSGNWILKKFNYYFIFPSVLREKYYLLKYGDISKGYREDKFFRKIDSFSTHLRAATFGKENDKENLYNFVTELTDQGKIFIFAFAPEKTYPNPNYWQNLKIYFKENFSNNPRVITADFKGTFTKDNLSTYILDGLHYSEKGNSAVAQSLLQYINFTFFESEK